MTKRSKDEFPEQRRRRVPHPLVRDYELEIILKGRRPYPQIIADNSRNIYKYNNVLTEHDKRKLKAIYRHDNYREPWNRRKAVQLMVKCCISMELMPNMALLEAALHPIRLPLEEKKKLLTNINIFLNTKQNGNQER